MYTYCCFLYFSDAWFAVWQCELNCILPEKRKLDRRSMTPLTSCQVGFSKIPISNNVNSRLYSFALFNSNGDQRVYESDVCI